MATSSIRSCGWSVSFFNTRRNHQAEPGSPKCRVSAVKAFGLKISAILADWTSVNVRFKSGSFRTVEYSVRETGVWPIWLTSSAVPCAMANAVKWKAHRKAAKNAAKRPVRLQRLPNSSESGFMQCTLRRWTLAVIQGAGASMLTCPEPLRLMG